MLVVVVVVVEDLAGGVDEGGTLEIPRHITWVAYLRWVEALVSYLGSDGVGKEGREIDKRLMNMQESVLIYFWLLFLMKYIHSSSSHKQQDHHSSPGLLFLRFPIAYKESLRAFNFFPLELSSSLETMASKLP